MSTYEIFKNLKRDDKDNVRQTISNYVYVLNAMRIGKVFRGAFT